MGATKGHRLVLLAAPLLACVACSHPTEPSDEHAGESARERRYGALMAEVGHRFELLGRAGRAHRWELARFELDELRESFGDLAAARPPRRSGGVELGGLEQAFLETDPRELESALRARDGARFATAFGHAAATCNGCHRATEHAFIEIPAVPGDPVPSVDPVP